MNWMTIVAVTIVSLGFVSCGDDDDGPVVSPGSGYTASGNTPSNSELVNMLQGTWEFNKGTETVSGLAGLPGMTVNIDRSMLGSLKAQMEQSLGSRVEFWDVTLRFNGSKLNNVNYSVVGQKIILEGVDESDGVSVSVKSISTTTLVLHEVINMEGLNITADMEYKKN